MKKIFLCLIFLFLASCSNHPNKNIGEETAKFNTINYTGMFIGLNPSTNSTYNCSMVRVNNRGKTVILTAAHCCKMEVPNIIHIVKKDSGLDLCVIDFPQQPKKLGGARLSSKKEVKLLDTVYRTGITSEGLFFSRGYVLEIYSQPFSFVENNEEYNFDAGQIKDNAFTKPGMSGGATFDENGDLLGINSRYNIYYMHGIFTPVNKIKEFLDR